MDKINPKTAPRHHRRHPLSTASRCASAFRRASLRSPKTRSLLPNPSSLPLLCPYTLPQTLIYSFIPSSPLNPTTHIAVARCQSPAARTPLRLRLSGSTLPASLNIVPFHLLFFPLLYLEQTLGPRRVVGRRRARHHLQPARQCAASHHHPGAQGEVRGGDGSRRRQRNCARRPY